MSHLHENKGFDKFQTFSPDQPFKASYEINGQRHNAVVQWMGEGKGVTPAYYVFEDEAYTDQSEYPAITAEEWAALSDEQLGEIYPDEKELHPTNAIRVLEYTDGIGWIERSKGKTEHSEAIGKTIEKRFS